jgi:hypothetical protein
MTFAQRATSNAPMRRTATKTDRGPRLYKTGPTASVEYLNSEEIDTERLEAKTDVDTICNSQTEALRSPDL